ncbi:MAG TPA: hypothetical protein VMZ91_05760 [Candidatus Paceibacterota bacterium]|nr:hypothetical protein [Candidatus Paceibacterota bacterium]
MGKKYTLEQVQQIFKENGCELLEEEYKNNKTKMSYKCKCKNVSEISLSNFLKGKRCNICGKNKKYTLEYVKQYFKNRGCDLLEKTYKNRSTKMLYKCACGNISKISFSSFLFGSYCRECKKIRARKRLQHSYSYVKNYFNKYGCKLMEKEYINNITLMKYKCKCGKISKSNFANFRKSKRCQSCAGNKKYSFKEVKKYFKYHNCELLENTYINCDMPIKYKCLCGNTSITRFCIFKQGHRCKKCGNERTGEKNRGENSPNWNPNLTNEDRLLQRSRLSNTIYKKWRNSVFKRDNYICCKCNARGGLLNAHHILNFSSNPGLRTKIKNGVTFCKKCHIKFHSKFGIKNNSLQQINMFCNN